MLWYMCDYNLYLHSIIGISYGRWATELNDFVNSSHRYTLSDFSPCTPYITTAVISPPYITTAVFAKADKHLCKCLLKCLLC